MTVFRDWPYLYDGDETYERGYIQTYVASARAAIIAAFDGDAVIGASTCLPLADETANVTQPFTDSGLDVAQYFYFGESVLLAQYRGRGLGVKFFAAREAHARGWGDYRFAAFCAVQRPETHPLRPADYVPLDGFWANRGYTKQPQLTCKMRWLDIGETAETEKALMFWTKPL